MKIKRIIAVFAAIAALCSCGVLTDQTSPEEQAMILERLNAQSYKVDIQFMLPRRGPQQALTTPYSVTIDGGHIISHLPYVGEAWDLPYGGGKGLNFESPIDEYSRSLNAFGGGNTIIVTTDNEEDYLQYRIEVSADGRVNLTVRSQHRETISYRGRIDPYTNPAEKKD